MANTTLVLGLLGILLLSGFIFMTMRPGHKMITLITLFDSMLIFRIVFGLPELSSFMHAIFPSFYISDRACLSLQIFFLMLGGIMGSLLANQLFADSPVVDQHQVGDGLHIHHAKAAGVAQ